MTEQPIDVAAPPDQADPGNYTWQDLAGDLDGMHDGLRLHAERLIEAHGVTVLTPGEVTVANTVDVGPPAEEVVVESIEQNQTTAEERKEALAFGLKTLYQMLGDQKLDEKCEAAGIDPTDMDNPAYWRIVANHAKERVARLRDLAGDSLKLHAIELVATTPAYLYEQTALRSNNYTDMEAARKSSRIISDYHSAMTELVQKYPDMKVTELTMGLLNTVNATIDDREMRQSAAAEIKKRIVGVQHEVGFEEILRHTGIRYRRATQDEDRQGYDFVLNDGAIDVMRLDVKARLEELVELGTEGLIARDEKGIYVVFSLLGASEFKGGFHISDDVAKARAKKLLEVLDNVDQYSTVQSA